MKMRRAGRRVWLPVLMLATAVLAARAGETPAPEPEVFSKVYEYGRADAKEIKEALGQVLSEKGKTVFLEDKGKVLVQDEKGRFEMIDAVMALLIGKGGAAPAVGGPNIRVEIGFEESASAGGGGFGVEGNVGGRDIRVGNRRRPGVDVDVYSGTHTRSRTQSQFLVVQSGGSASLNVVREVPVVDYFYSYATRLGLWEERQLRWERVGTQLVVEPVWRNGLIEVTVLPRISALAGGRHHAIDIRELATRVTVAEGRTLHLGGFQGAEESFHRHFFGRGGQSGTQSGGFTLRASRAESFPTPE